jgi:hypothetical protein
MTSFKELDRIEPDTPVGELKKAAVRDLQRALGFLGYPFVVIDGLVGPRTRNALAEFKDSIGEGKPDVLTETVIAALQGKATDLDGLIAAPGSNTKQVKEAIIGVCKGLDIGLKTQIAYVLATTEWETAHTFKPVKEAFWLSENWRKTHLSYYPFYGRGYVQLTWKRNYQAYSDILNINLVENPDLALDHNTALFVLVHGFKTGTFTGRRITDYINTKKTNYISARGCINGTDKASEIAMLAEGYEEDL